MKIVLFDIETLPDLREVMRIFPGLSNYYGLTLKAQINSIICCGWKVFGDKKKANVINAWDDKERWAKNKNDDRYVLEKMLDVMKDADAVVTHNGKRFDWKFFQTRLMLNGFNPIHEIPHIDTCQLAKKNLMMFNNRLNNLGQAFVKDKKIENGGWDLWTRIQFEDRKKDKVLMSKYCAQDVDLLEKLFKKLRPFAKNIPNHNLDNKDAGKKECCPNCGSTRLHSNGYRHTKTSSYKRMICGDCNSWSRADIKGKNLRSI